MKAEKNVDVAIIGAGTAGISAASEVRKLTNNFVILDPGPLGTTCARVGCMPSKVLIQIANDFHRRFKFDEQGIRGGSQLKLDQKSAFRHVRALRDRFVASVLKDFETFKDQWIEEAAEFEESNLLRAGGLRIRAKKIILATGSTPVVPKEWKDFSEQILTSDTLFEQEELSGSLAVIGLGSLGLELGQALSRFGLAVQAFGSNAALGGLTDPEVQKVALEILSKEFPISLEGRAEVTGLAAANSKPNSPLSNEKPSGAHFQVRSGTKCVETQKILSAVGRKPNFENLGMTKLDLKWNSSGYPVYDRKTMQVEGQPLFLAGDVDGDRLLLHEAADDGRIAGYNSVHTSHSFKRRAKMGITFTDPNIAVVGESYRELQSREIAIGEVRFENQGRALVKQENQGLLRLYADPQSGILLGAEMIAPAAEHFAHLLAWSIQQNLTVMQLLQMPFYHPVLEEGIRTALRSLLKQVKCPQESYELAFCQSGLRALE